MDNSYFRNKVPIIRIPKLIFVYLFFKKIVFNCTWQITLNVKLTKPYIRNR